MEEVHVEQSAERMTTLDEPILETLKRDVYAIGHKLIVVVWPSQSNDQEMREWDLWGPLFLCLTLALILASKAGSSESGLVFCAVFVIVWLGAAVVTLNAKFLGSTISFFQTVCIMGYCIAPICVGTLVGLIFSSVVVHFMIALIVCGWALWAALRFFRGTTAPEKEILVVYPVGLFYGFLTWMAVVGI